MSNLDIPALRKARGTYASLRASLSCQLTRDLELATATAELIRAAQLVMQEDERVPYVINFERNGDPEELVGTLSRVCTRRRSELQPLAESYGMGIMNHPAMVDRVMLSTQALDEEFELE